MRFPDARALLIVGLILAGYILSVSLVPARIVAPSVTLTVTATGEKNPASQGTEVWVLEAPGLHAGLTAAGWERREHALVSYLNQPSQLVLTAPVRSTRPLRLMTHPFSGKATVRVADVERTIDLFSPQSGEAEVRIGKLVADSRDRLLRSLMTIGFLAVFLAAGGWIYRRWFAWPNSRQALFVFASCAVGAHILLTNVDEIGLHGIALTLGWFMLVVWVELLIINQMTRWFSGRLAEVAILSPVFALNVYSSFFVSFVGQATVLGGYLAGTVLVFSLILWSLEYSIGRRLGFLFCGGFAGLAITSAIFSAPVFRVTEEVKQTSTAAVRSPGRPNIYFLSFDGVASKTALKSLFRADNIKLWPLLERNGFSVRDARSPGRYTLETFYRIFTLQPSGQPSFDFILGFDESPILERLKAAGYRIQSIQGSSYFGILNNRWDYFHPDRRSAVDYCWSALDRTVFFFGVCRIFAGLRRDQPIRHLGRVEERARVAAASNEPWFTFAHVLAPGHTSSVYTYDDTRQRQRFVARYLEVLDGMAEPLESLLATINKHDPTAVIIFHSDHGAWLTRGWPVIPAHAAARELDLTSVPLAVRPSGFCSGQLEEISTTADVLPTIFGCLGL